MFIGPRSSIRMRGWCSMAMSCCKAGRWPTAGSARAFEGIVDVRSLARRELPQPSSPAPCGVRSAQIRAAWAPRRTPPQWTANDPARCPVVPHTRPMHSPAPSGRTRGSRRQQRPDQGRHRPLRGAGADRLAYPSARPDAACRVGNWPRRALGRADPRSPRGRHACGSRQTKRTGTAPGPTPPWPTGALQEAATAATVTSMEYGTDEQSTTGPWP